MRIAYVFDQLLPNTGADTAQALMTVAALNQQGAEVVLFLPRHAWGDDANADALRAYYGVDGPLEIRRLRSLFPTNRVVEKAAHAVRSVIHRELGGFDLVYTRNIPTMVASLSAGYPVVYETYRPWPRQIPALRPLFRVAMRHRNFVGGVMHSEYARQAYIQSAGAAPDALLVAHNGYDPARFEPRLSAAEARRALGLPEDKQLVVYTGRVSNGKGLGLVLEMAQALPHTHFVLVGSEGDGPIERRAAHLPNVQIFGWQSSELLPTYLFAADVLMIPPSVGPLNKVGNTVLPIKLFIYLAAGRAIMAPRAPDTAELLQHDVNAWLVEADDAVASTDALRALLADTALQQRLAAGALDTASDLTWNARGEKLIRFIEERMPSPSR